MKKWQRLRSDIVLDTPYFRLRRDACRLPDGREIDDYYVSEVEDIVLVIAITPDDEVILVKQYKHGIGDICIELPAGMCEANSDNPLADAQRELREETGYTSDDWHKLATLISNPTRSNNHSHFYLAQSARKTDTQSLDPNETIEVQRIPLTEIRSTLLSGVVNVTDSITGLLLAFNWLDTHKGNTS